MEKLKEFRESVLKNLAVLKSNQSPHVTGLTVAASTDYQSLSGECLKRFHTNYDLAIARANYVARQIALMEINLPASVMVNVPTKFGNTERSVDRRVTVYQIVTEPDATAPGDPKRTGATITTPIAGPR